MEVYMHFDIETLSEYYKTKIIVRRLQIIKRHLIWKYDIKFCKQ